MQEGLKGGGHTQEAKLVGGRAVYVHVCKCECVWIRAGGV